MHKLLVYGSLCNEKQLKEVLGRVPKNSVETLTGYKRDNTATWKFYQNCKTNNKWFQKDGKFIKFQPSYLTLKKSLNDKTVGLVITVTDKELSLLDDREGVLDEIPCYKRVIVTLENGTPVWVYIAVNTTITNHSKCASEYLDACESDIAKFNAEILSNFNQHKNQFSIPIIQTDGIYSLSQE